MNSSPFWWDDEEAQGQTVPVATPVRHWDLYFLNLARSVGLASKCASRSIGAVIVRDRYVLSTGYNGAPRGVDLCQDVAGECPRHLANILSGEGLHLCPAAHAESNAIAVAAANGVSTAEASIFCYCKLPCVWCAGMIINAGIVEVVHLRAFRRYSDAYHPLAERMFEDAGVVCQSYTEQEVAEWVACRKGLRPDLDLTGGEA